MGKLVSGYTNIVMYLTVSHIHSDKILYSALQQLKIICFCHLSINT